MALGTVTMWHGLHLRLAPDTHHPKREPNAHRAEFFIIPSAQPWQPSLRLRVYLVEVFYMGGVLRLVAFGVWLLALAVALRFIHVASCGNTHPSDG